MTKVVGQNLPHDSAVMHVTGVSQFIDDRPFMQGELLVDYVGSPLAKGRIEQVDFTAALKVDGVVGVYTALDLSHNAWGPIFQTEPFLAENEVTYVGQPIVVIAAKTQKALREAKQAVVLNIKEEPAVLSIDDAKANEDFLGPIRHIKRGDVQKAFAEASHVLEGTFKNDGQEQFYLESQAAIAYPGEHGQMEVHSSTQHPTEVQHCVAHAMGVPLSKVTCIVKRMGGGFGGKESQAVPFAVMAALVAKKTGQAARCVITKDDDMITTGKRHPFQTDYKIAFDDDGKILGFQTHLYSDGGAYEDLSTSVMERAMLHSDNAYFIPNIEIQGIVCRTNHHPHTAFRGFGGPQGIAVIENLMEDIAQVVGKDPYEVRKINCYHGHNNTAPYGQEIANNTLPEIFEKLTSESEYKARYENVLAFNKTSQTKIRGISFQPVKFGISFTARFLNQGSALVSVHKDGSVQVSTGGTEMGQGVNIKVAQVVAHCFGLPIEAVQVLSTSTDRNANTSPTAASTGADINCSAALKASQKIKERLKKAAAVTFAKLPPEEGLDADLETSGIVFADGSVWDEKTPDNKISFEDLVHQTWFGRSGLQEHAFYKTPGIQFDKDTGQGTPFHYFTNGAAVSEVEIDRFTGELKVLRSDILMDLGSMINPGVDRGQTIGAFVQGMGWVTTEKLVYDDAGKLLSHSPTTYKIPNIQDTPRVLNVNFLDNPHNTVNVHGSKAVGEPPLVLGLSVWTAVKQALASVKGEPVNIRLPATSEEILLALES